MLKILSADAETDVTVDVGVDTLSFVLLQEQKMEPIATPMVRMWWLFFIGSFFINHAITVPIFTFIMYQLIYNDMIMFKIPLRK